LAERSGRMVFAVGETGAVSSCLADLTESKKETISALSTVAGGLAGAAVGGTASSTEAGASAAQNSVDNNQLSVNENITLQMDERAYAASCSGASSDGCQTLKQTIDELKQKGSSVLPTEKTVVGDDFFPGGVIPSEHKPGDVVGCVISGNSTCVVSDQMVTTPLGQEYVLTPANDAQVVELQSQEAQRDAQLKQISSQLMANGNFGLGGALLDGYNAVSGTDPVTGQALTTGQRVLSGIASVFNLGGAVAPIFDLDGVAVEPADGAKGLGKDYVDILSPEAKQHILYGDKPGSGGHMWPGQEGKTVFPESWSGDKIVDAVGDITTSPSTKWYAQTGTGGAYTAKGDAAKWVAYETRDGVRMRVVYQPATGKVVTAFPDDAPIPPYKPIK